MQLTAAPDSTIYVKRMGGLLVFRIALGVISLSLVLNAALRSAEDAASNANTIALAAADLAKEGKVEPAEHLLYNALLRDDQCAVALHELGKLLQAQNDPAAQAVLADAE